MSTHLSSADSALLALLKRQGSLHVEELGRALEVTPTAIRQRLQRLMAEGWIAREVHRHGRGRPSHRYSLTDKALRQLGVDFEHLAMALWREFSQIEPAEQRERILLRVAQSLAAQYGPGVTGVSLLQKMEAVRQILDTHGISFEVRETASLPVLTTCQCPFPRLAEADRSICSLEEQMLSKLLDQPMQLSECRLDGHHQCRFESR